MPFVPIRLAGLALVLLLPATGACRERAEAEEAVPADTAAVGPAAMRVAVSPGVPLREDGQWLMPAHDYASTRFSGRDAINRSRGARLELAAGGTLYAFPLP